MIITVESASKLFVTFCGLLQVQSCPFWNESGVLARRSDRKQLICYSIMMGFWPDFGDLTGVGEKVQPRDCICFSCQALKFESSFFILN